MESALTEFHWSTFESWVWLNEDRIFEAWLRVKAEKKEKSSRVGQEEEDSEPSERRKALRPRRKKRVRPPWGWPPLRTMTGGSEAAKRCPERASYPFFLRAKHTPSRGKSWERAQSALFVMAFPLLHDTGEMADFMRESFRWRWRSVMRPLHPLPDDCQDLCLCFVISEAEQAALDFELPKMVHATFYAMLLNNSVRLGLVGGFIAASLKVSLEGLQWSSFESWILRTRPSRGTATPSARARGCLDTSERPRGELGLQQSSTLLYTEQVAEYVRDNFRWSLREPLAPGPRLLHLDYHGLCPPFDFEAAMQNAHDSNISGMVQVIFYAMVIDDAAELGLSCRLTMDCVMWATQKVDWCLVEAWLRDINHRLWRAQASQPANPLVGPDTTHAAEYVRDNLRWYFAHVARILEMVEVIFYAMVISDAAELRLSSRDAIGDMILELQELTWDIVDA
ncbi:LOW QUALITY PROTEIN: hypothetical protein Cgig2_002910 [Carnegiea gigantea]|uniref:Uncharacterized protein n=1 Tax=Carnegiea gigantea TaxID=171969 RepID=A0A9Q1GMR3_9CARY|nr:LOW QUALITY PROTEIN: hypothetical protein Cgig2_002910 [Carnegiea gigantea]